MYTSKWCNENINLNDKISFSQVKGELVELIEARTMENFKEEIGDVLYFGYCWLESNCRINLPMLGAKSSIEKFIKRFDMWKEIFRENDLEFDKKYLVNGSNYKKQKKIDLALGLARNEQIK